MNGYEKMREACSTIAEYAKSAQCHTEDAHVLGYLRQMENWSQAALSLPPRQCDVGTADKQAERQHRFCLAHRCGPGCPAWRDGQAHNGCVLVWAQMPYAEEGGAAQ